MITKEMTVLEIVENYPETEEAFRSFDSVLGRCLLCSNLFDSIEDIAETYGLDAEELIARLNAAIKE